MSIQVNRLTNASIYIDGASFVGRAEEVTLPTVKQKMSEHKALGMVGSFELPAGVDKLEASIKWNAFYADALKKVGNPTKAVQLQIRGNLETWGSTGREAEVAAVVLLTATFKEIPMGSFKQHDNVELTSALNVTACKMTIDGETIIDLDVLSNIYFVAGVDILENYRLNLGL